MNRLKVKLGSKLRIYLWSMFQLKPVKLWHPEGSGIRVTVLRSKFERLYKSKYFATNKEIIKLRSFHEKTGK